MDVRLAGVKKAQCNVFLHGHCLYKWLVNAGTKAGMAVARQW